MKNKFIWSLRHQKQFKMFFFLFFYKQECICSCQIKILNQLDSQKIKYQFESLV